MLVANLLAYKANQLINKNHDCIKKKSHIVGDLFSLVYDNMTRKREREKIIMKIIFCRINCRHEILIECGYGKVAKMLKLL